MGLITVVENTYQKDKDDNRSEVFKLQREHIQRCHDCATKKSLSEKREICKTFEAYITLLLHLPR